MAEFTKRLHVGMAWMEKEGHACRHEILTRTLFRSGIPLLPTSWSAPTLRNAIMETVCSRELHLLLIDNEVGLPQDEFRANCEVFAKKAAGRYDGLYAWLPRRLRRELHMIFLRQGIITPDMSLVETLYECWAALQQRPRHSALAR